MKKLMIFLAAVFFLGFLCNAQAQQTTPDEQRSQAFYKIRVANELLKKGEDLLMQTHNKDNITAAFQIYLQAGKLYEEAGTALKALGTKYVSQVDIDNSFKAAQFCADTMKKIKDSIGAK